MDSPPPLGLRGLLHQASGLCELPRHLWYWPQLRRQPGGHNQPVILIPGHGAGDRSTWLLRAYLRYLGYQARGWGLGANHGDHVHHIEVMTTHLGLGISPEVFCLVAQRLGLSAGAD